MAEKEKPIWEVITQDGSFPADEPETEMLSEDEQRAMEKGWKPQSEWDGNPNEWRSAKEYLDRGSLFEKINNQRKELDEMRRFQMDAQEHLRKLRESNEKDRLERLNRQKREAIEENDIEAILTTDRNIREVETELTKISQPQIPDADPVADQMFNEWKDDNPWYDSDKELHILADALGTSFRANNPNATPQEVYNFVTEKVKSTNPTKFNSRDSNAQSRSPNSMTQQTRRSEGSGKTFHDLNEDQLRVGRRFVKLGLYKNIQGYIDELATLGEI